MSQEQTLNVAIKYFPLLLSCSPHLQKQPAASAQHADTHQLSLWDAPRHTKQPSVWISQGQAKFKKNKETIIVNHIGNASKIWIEELLTASESHFTVRKTQSEHYWVLGEVLTPKYQGPESRAIKCMFYELSLQEGSINYSSHGKRQAASTKGCVFAIMC